MFLLIERKYFRKRISKNIPEAAIDKVHKRITNNPGSKIASGADRN
jgi:hypothetical protein